MTNSPSKLVNRPPRTIPVLLSALFFLALGIIGMWVFGVKLFDGQWPEATKTFIAAVSRTELGAPWVIGTAIALTIVGFVLLVCALVPGDQANREILPGDIPGQSAISRRQFSNYIKSHLARLDGVHAVRANLHGKKLDIDLSTTTEESEILKNRAVKLVEQLVDSVRFTDKIEQRIRIRKTS